MQRNGVSGAGRESGGVGSHGGYRDACRDETCSDAHREDWGGGADCQIPFGATIITLLLFSSSRLLVIASIAEARAFAAFDRIPVGSQRSSAAKSARVSRSSANCATRSAGSIA